MEEIKGTVERVNPKGIKIDGSGTTFQSLWKTRFLK
jgi:hypothetical protein